MKKEGIYESVKTGDRGFQVKVLLNHQSGAPLHWHEYFELLYFLEGNINVLFGNEIYHTKPGDFLIVNTNELHDIEHTSATHHICLQISPQFFADVEFDNYIFKTYIHGDEYIKEYIEKIADVWQRHEAAYDMEIKSLTYSLMAYLVKNHTVDYLTGNAIQMRKNKLNIINEIVVYITNNYNQHMTTSTLAKEFHMTEQYFCHIFKQATDNTPIEFINKKRIEKAGVYLKTTDLSITDISLRVGFDSSHYFTRVFKKYMGVSPREYRNAAMLSQT